jgi:hypothetical protein
MSRSPLHAYIFYKSGIKRTVYYANTREADKARAKLAGNKKVKTAICYDGSKNITYWFITQQKTHTSLQVKER